MLVAILIVACVFVEGAAAGPDSPTGVDREPLLGAYVHLGRLFSGLKTSAEREEAIAMALDRMRSSGLNTVMPYVTLTNGKAAYPSGIISEHEYGDWDPLAVILQAARARDLKVYPVFCVLACGHDEPAGILRTHPEWALRRPDGAPMGHICPANPDARDWVTSVICELVAEYEVDGVLLDYLRYYNRPTLLDAASEAAFEQYRAEHPGAAVDELNQQFREQQLTKLARQISGEVRAIRPGIRIAIYSWGPHVARNHRVAQAWPEWSRAGYVDIVNISGYCYPDNYGDAYLDVFRKRIGDAVALNEQQEGRAAITFCLGVSTSHGRIESASWVEDYLARAADARASGVAFFTWSTLQPFLDEVDEVGYVSQFAERVGRR